MEELLSVPLPVLLVGVAVIAFSLGRAVGRGEADEKGPSLADYESTSNAYADMASSTQEEVDRLVAKGKTISAVKLLREQSGVDLRTAKKLVDARRKLLKGST
ncbi:MAG: hypothetical protein AAF850_02315 [Pseudomonadota bacterium]